MGETKLALGGADGVGENEGDTFGGQSETRPREQARAMLRPASADGMIRARPSCAD
jgi:hypothetical protein